MLDRAFGKAKEIIELVGESSPAERLELLRACWIPMMPSGDSRAMALLVGVWVGLVVLVDPRGDFPLNDDWAYGWSVQHFLATGEFELSDWTAINLFTQVLWGSLFCWPLGFSFTALRLSTLTLGLIGVVATYWVLRETKSSPGVSLVGALAVALNPIYFGLANSFMSDVPSFSFTIVSAYFLMRALQRYAAPDLISGIAVSLMSILNRQTGLLVLPAFALAYLTKTGVHPRSLARAAVPGVLGFALYLLYPRWLELTGKTPHLYDLSTTWMFRSLSSGLSHLVVTYGRNLFVMSVYLGLFLLPFLVITLAGVWPTAGTRLRRKTVAVVALVAVVAVWTPRFARLPSVGNVLDVVGIGPSAISGSLASAGVSSQVVGRIWQTATVVGVVGAALLLAMLFGATREAITSREAPHLRALAVFGMAMVVLYLLPIGALAHGQWFDRYLIALLPFLMIPVSIWARAHSGATRPAWATPLCVILLLVYGVFTLSATHDFLSWNRVQWQAVHALVEESHVSVRHVSAGWEVSGWFFGNRLATCNPERQLLAKASDRSWKDFPCLSTNPEAVYSVSPVARPGQPIERQYAFRRWLPPGEQAVYVLRVDPSAR